MPAKQQILEFFIDESSQTKHRYLVLGGLITSVDYSEKLTALIAAARLPELPLGEAKWTKVSRTKLPAYKRIVNVLFDNPTEMHFHSLFIDTTKIDHRKYNDGDREIGFNKEIYQLGIKASKLYGNDLFHVYPDYRDTNQNPGDLRLILNRGCAKYGDKRDWPFRRCQFRNSQHTPALQLTDILIGAIAYRLNGHDKADGASPAKSELCAHILERAKVADVHKGTARQGTFTIWARQLR